MQSGLKPDFKGKGLVLLITSVMMIHVIFTGCDRGPNDKGWDYFPDMMYSSAYQTWTENPVLAGGMTNQPPVEGTIPRNFIPYQYEKSDEDLVRAGVEITNPLELTEAHVARGEQVYGVYCMICHGVKGDGLGHLYTSGRYVYPPASLIAEKARALPDGSIYHVITVGFGVMAPHGPIVLPEDRWKVIHYIRQELQANTQ
jgi:mono/diheme cytochrome c family protein